jgi:hypothetical protein
MKDSRLDSNTGAPRSASDHAVAQISECAREARRDRQSLSTADAGRVAPARRRFRLAFATPRLNSAGLSAKVASGRRAGR